jgi:hypothetical protein
MLRVFVTVLAFGLLTACTQTDTYPVSGDECGPNDPVRGMEAQDCMPPAPTS